MALAGVLAVTAALSAEAAPHRGKTVRISVPADGQQVEDGGNSPSISGDGRYVAFQSTSPGLVPDDTDSQTDVFLRDLRKGTIERISVRDDGSEYPLSAWEAAVSSDGRYIAYTAGTGSYEDHTTFYGVYLKDRRKKRTELVSLMDDERPVAQAYGVTQVSRDGRYVAFAAYFSETGETAPGMRSGIYLRDRELGTTKLISTSTPPVAGGTGWGVGYYFSMSADGSRIAYSLERGRGTYYVHLWDRRTGRTELFDQGSSVSGAGRAPTFSGDGRYVAFRSAASDLVPGDTNGVPDVFVRDLRRGTTERVSLAADGGELDQRSETPVITGDGRHVFFTSTATGLVPGGTQPNQLYVRDLRRDITRQVTAPLTEDDSPTWPVAAPSRDGRTVAFESFAENLVPDDTNRSPDVFVRRMR